MIKIKPPKRPNDSHCQAAEAQSTRQIAGNGDNDEEDLCAELTTSPSLASAGEFVVTI